MRGGWKFSALKSTSKIALWVTLQAENLPNPSIYRIFAAFKTPTNAAYEQKKRNVHTKQNALYQRLFYGYALSDDLRSITRLPKPHTTQSQTKRFLEVCLYQPAKWPIETHLLFYSLQNDLYAKNCFCASKHVFPARFRFSKNERFFGNYTHYKPCKNK